MVKIEPLSKNLPPLNFLVYADSGAGKTVFAGSADKVLFVAPEDSGLLSAAMLNSKADKIKVKNWEQFVEAYDWCYDNQDDLAEKYDWIVIDSSTEMQSMCMRGILKSVRESRVSKDQDPDVPQIQDYQKLYVLMENMALAFNDLCVNTLYTALARTVETADGQDMLMPMLGSNKPTDFRIAMKFAAMMTSYGYLNVEIVEKPKDPAKPDGEKKKVKQRVIYWETTDHYSGKDRTTRLAPKTILPAKNALQFVTRIARGEIDRDGKPIAATARATIKAAPAKAAAQKPTAKATIKAPIANPANTKDDAVDIVDSVPQHVNENGNGEPTVIVDLENIEA